jgi:hypothetical protein
MLLLKEVAAGQGSAGNRMCEGLWLRLGCWRGSESSLGFSWRGGSGEEVDLLADTAAKVGDILADVAIVVALSGILSSK